MDLEGIREALHQQPFQPFAIRLSDGRSLPVRHPDFVAVGNRRIVVIDERDSWSFVEPFLIVSLDKLPPRAAKSNGKGKSKGGKS